MECPKVAVLGAGVIGASWAALFAASGRSVTVYDPQPEAQEKLRAFAMAAGPALRAQGFSAAGDLSRLRVTNSVAEAVEGADIIQESVPERLDVKRLLFKEVAPLMKNEAILASSSSGLRLSEMAEGFERADALILAHPFNPPHLIPLVELMATAATAEDVLPRARAFYEGLGKTCVTLQREVTGHIANRLQAAVWREAVHLALSGVADLAEIDRAMTAGPGLRWAVSGPSTLFHLGGGEGGIAAFLKHLGDPMQSWWDDLGAPDLTPEVRAAITAGITEALEGRSVAELAAARDAEILRILDGRKG